MNMVGFGWTQREFQSITESQATANWKTWKPNRDKGKPRGCFLPDHRTCGSAYGGSVT